MSALFSNAGGSVIFSLNPTRPPRSRSLIQAREESAGAVPFGYIIYRTDDLLTLDVRMTNAEVPTFLTFWQSVARGMAVAFNYTDPIGAVVSVKFNDSRLPEIREKAYNLHLATVTLRVQ